MTQHDRTMRAVNILAKWRAHFAGWQLGTRMKGDPESDAVRDHREATILLRAEVNAVVGLLLKSGVVTEEAWLRQLQEEAEALCKMYEAKWPGAHSSLDGMTYDVVKSRAWMQGWRP